MGASSSRRKPFLATSRTWWAGAIGAALLAAGAALPGCARDEPNCERCRTPPAAECLDAQRLHTYVVPGTCLARGGCAYEPRDVVCTPPVADGTARCEAGGCRVTCGATHFACGDTCCAAARKVFAGADQTCATGDGGMVRCWGATSGGPAGSAAQGRPGAIEGLAADVVAIAAGQAHACALDAGGGVACWGDGEQGQVGQGRFERQPTPMVVGFAGTGVSAIAAGSRHSCAMGAEGGIRCWGDDVFGQLGDGTRSSRNAPIDVTDLRSGATAIAAGGYETCAVLRDGALDCWGSNIEGALGTGSTTPSGRLVPGAVEGLGRPVRSVAVGWSHVCALDDTGGIACWGGNSSGALGDGTTESRSLPAAVLGFAAKERAAGGEGSDHAVAVVAGDGHTCAATAAGAVLCWGANDRGQLGDGTAERRLTPTPVQGLASPVVWLAAGARHTCAVTADGGLLCWGANDRGQLGDGTTIDRSTPTQVVGFL